jgi:hypothetical protein
MVKRRVISVTLRDGVMSIFRDRRYLGYKWDLDLECGHTVYRKVRYIGKRANYRSQNRPVSDIAAPPKWVYCEWCQVSLPSGAADGGGGQGSGGEGEEREG